MEKICGLWYDNCEQDFMSIELLKQFAKLLKQIVPQASSKELKETKEAVTKLKRRVKAFTKELERASERTAGAINNLGYETLEDQRNYLLSNLDEKKFPKSTMKKKTSKSELDVEKLDYYETARQLTLIDHYLLKRITNSEFFSVAWEKKSKDTEAPNIVNFIARFNQVPRSFWISVF